MTCCVTFPATRNCCGVSPPAPTVTMWYSVTDSLVGGSHARVYCPGCGPLDSMRRLFGAPMVAPLVLAGRPDAAAAAGGALGLATFCGTALCGGGAGTATVGVGDARGLGGFACCATEGLVATFAAVCGGKMAMPTVGVGDWTSWAVVPIPGPLPSGAARSSAGPSGDAACCPGEPWRCAPGDCGVCAAGAAPTPDALARASARALPNSTKLHRQ